MVRDLLELRDRAPVFADRAGAGRVLVRPLEGFRASAAADARARVERRLANLRAGRCTFALEGRTAIVVDDGIAAGSTMRAALAEDGAASRNLAQAIQRRFQPLGGVELTLPARESMRAPPKPGKPGRT